MIQFVICVSKTFLGLGIQNAKDLASHRISFVERSGEIAMYESQETSITRVISRLVTLDTDIPEPLEQWELEDFDDLVLVSEHIQ